MIFKKNAFPIINVMPNQYSTTENEWDSVGDQIRAKIPMNDHGKFHGTVQTFSNGRLLEERQYKDGKSYGAAVFYDICGKPMNLRILTDVGNFANFKFS